MSDLITLNIPSIPMDAADEIANAFGLGGNMQSQVNTFVRNNPQAVEEAAKLGMDIDQYYMNQVLGYDVGQSLIEESMVAIAKELLDKGKVILPEKVITSETFEGKNISEKNISDVGINEMILDQLVSQKIQDIVLSSKTILWNGPLGVFENDYFSKGTKELSKQISKSDAFSIAGGGETLSAINKFINKDDVSYCSTGGGAFLEFMEGKDLPSIQALKAKI